MIVSTLAMVKLMNSVKSGTERMHPTWLFASAWARNSKPSVFGPSTYMAEHCQGSDADGDMLWPVMTGKDSETRGKGRGLTVPSGLSKLMGIENGRSSSMWLAASYKQFPGSKQP